MDTATHSKRAPGSISWLRPRSSPRGEERTTAHASVGRFILLTHLILSPLIYSAHTTDAFELPRASLLALTALSLLALGTSWVLESLLAGPVLSSGRALFGRCITALRDPLLTGTLLLALSATISTVFSSAPWPSFLGADRSRAGLLTILSSAVLLVATRILCRSVRDLWQLLSAAVLASAVLAVHAVLQFFRLDPVRWDDVSTFAVHVRPFATLGHANVLAAYLAMALPLLGFLVLRAADDRGKIVVASLGAIGLVTLVAIVLTLSRGVWLGLACAVGLLLLFGGRGLWERRRSLGLAALGVVLVLGAALLAMGSRRADLIESLASRITGLTETSSRREIWKSSLAIFAEQPWIGCGPDLFLEAFGPHRTPAYWHLEWNATPQRAHNEPLHVLATQGLFGGGALTVFLLGLGMTGWRAWRRTEGLNRTLVACLLAAMMTFIVQNIFNFSVTGSSSLFLVLVGMLWALGDGQSDEGKAVTAGRWSAVVSAICILASLLLMGVNAASVVPTKTSWGVWWWILLGTGAITWACLFLPRRAGGVSPLRSRTQGANAPRSPGQLGALSWGIHVLVLLLFGPVAWLVVIQPLRADVACSEGEAALTQGDEVALDHLRRAAVISPFQEVYWGKLASADLVFAQAHPSGAERLRLLDEAGEALDQAARISPLNGSTPLSQAQTLAARAICGLNSSNEVVLALERAVRRDPHNAALLADAGFLLVGLKRAREAQDYFERGLAFDPDFARLRSGLGAVAILEERWQEAVAHFDAGGSAEWHGLRKERLDSLQMEALAYLAVGRLDQSEHAARLVLADRPHAHQARLILARGLEVRGRRTEAIEEYRRVQREDPGNGPAGNGVRRLTEGR